MVYIMYMYVNKRVELAQRGIAPQKIYVLVIISILKQDPNTKSCKKINYDDNKMSILCVHVIINKRSFEPFCVG